MHPYYESAIGLDITKERAIQEVLEHGGDKYEFLEDLGDHPIYEACEVLEWLGY